jgi:hypothetical protein
MPAAGMETSVRHCLRDEAEGEKALPTKRSGSQETILKAETLRGKRMVGARHFEYSLPAAPVTEVPFPIPSG